LSDALEIIYGTDMNNVDTDSDSMPDNYEIEQGFNPRDSSDGQEDADGDSLSNAFEYSLGLNPWRVDSDYDKIPDSWEIEYGLNPLVSDAHEDPDEDGRTNLEEYLDGTDPLHAESEGPAYPWYTLPSIVVVSILVVAGVVIWRESRILD
jgi:hypothetical protein